MTAYLPFEDRHEAGRQLAAALTPYRDQHPLILALPRGGVVTGYEVARALDAELDVLVSRKVGAPWHPELGIGAVAPGVTVADEEALVALGIGHEEFDVLADLARDEMTRRARLYRGSDGLPAVAGRTIIVVDDGVATGVTASAALKAVRRGHPGRVVLAVPVGATETVERLRDLADEIECLAQVEPFGAVGYFYRDFRQVTDEEVIGFLEAARDGGKVPSRQRSEDSRVRSDASSAGARGPSGGNRVWS